MTSLHPAQGASGSELDQFRKLLLGSALGNYDQRIVDIEARIVSLATTLATNLEVMWRTLRSEVDAVRAERKSSRNVEVEIDELRRRVESLEAANGHLLEDMRALQDRLVATSMRSDSALAEIQTKQQADKRTLEAVVAQVRETKDDLVRVEATRMTERQELVGMRRVADQVPIMLRAFADQLTGVASAAGPTAPRPSVPHGAPSVVVRSTPSNGEEESVITLSTGDLREPEASGARTAAAPSPSSERGPTAVPLQGPVASVLTSSDLRTIGPRPFTTNDLMRFAPEGDKSF